MYRRGAEQRIDQKERRDSSTLQGGHVGGQGKERNKIRLKRSQTLEEKEERKQSRKMQSGGLLSRCGDEAFQLLEDQQAASSSCRCHLTATWHVSNFGSRH